MGDTIHGLALNLARRKGPQDGDPLRRAKFYANS